MARFEKTRAPLAYFVAGLRPERPMHPAACRAVGIIDPGQRRLFRGLAEEASDEREMLGLSRNGESILEALRADTLAPCRGRVLVVRSLR